MSSQYLWLVTHLRKLIKLSYNILVSLIKFKYFHGLNLSININIYLLFINVIIFLNLIGERFTALKVCLWSAYFAETENFLLKIL